MVHLKGLNKRCVPNFLKLQIIFCQFISFSLFLSTPRCNSPSISAYLPSAFWDQFLSAVLSTWSSHLLVDFNGLHSVVLTVNLSLSYLATRPTYRHFSFAARFITFITQDLELVRKHRLIPDIDLFIACRRHLFIPDIPILYELTNFFKLSIFEIFLRAEVFFLDKIYNSRTTTEIKISYFLDE